MSSVITMNKWLYRLMSIIMRHYEYLITPVWCLSVFQPAKSFLFFSTSLFYYSPFFLSFSCFCTYALLFSLSFFPLACIILSLHNSPSTHVSHCLSLSLHNSPSTHVSHCLSLSLHNSPSTHVSHCLSLSPS